VIWAPHHSVTPQWLRFGTFVETYKEILEWVRRDKSVEIVFRPHPATLTKVVSTGRLSQRELDDFLTAWNALPNTAIDEREDFAFAFAASDALLTDGISFLAEYQPMDKPIVFLENKAHEKLTELGHRVVEATYSVASAAEAIALLDRIRHEKFDPLRNIRRAVLRELMPFPGQSAMRILDEIRMSLRDRAADVAKPA
jgi:hypothetical protein